MFKPLDQFNYANSWMKYAIAYSQMSIAASEVILRRSIRMSQGAMTAPEVIGMVIGEGDRLRNGDRTSRGRGGDRRRSGQDRHRGAAADPRQDPLERPQVPPLSPPPRPGGAA